jgi:GntR family transcriptional regulator
MSLRTRINHGEWEENTNLPSFEDLAKDYGVSLNTIRNSIQLLVNEGFVHSSRGVGTRVLSRPIHHNELRSSISDPLELAEHVSIEILESKNVNSLALNLKDQYQESDSYRKVTKTHSVGGIPFALLEIYVDKHCYDKFPKNAERHSKISKLLRNTRQSQIRSSREELTVISANPELSKVLRYPLTAPIVQLRRWRMDQNQKVIYACIASYRSDHFVWDVTRVENSQAHFNEHIIPKISKIKVENSN